MFVFKSEPSELRKRNFNCLFVYLMSEDTCVRKKMSHFFEERHLIHSRTNHACQSKPINVETINMETKIHENKGSFFIDALLSKDDERPNSPDNTSRSISPSSSTRSRSSPPISPGSEEIPPNNPFVPRPGLLSHIYPNSGTFYGYQAQPQSSAFHHLDGSTTAMVQKVQLPVNHHGQLQQMHLEWFARTGMFYPRLPDLTGK